MYRYEDLKHIEVNLAELSQYIKIEKIENLRYFGQARCDNFISVGCEGHSLIWHKHLKNINILKSQFLSSQISLERIGGF
jgi:hypothetical protein